MKNAMHWYVNEQIGAGPTSVPSAVATSTDANAALWRAYRGLAILNTNHKAALDPAFQRRLRFVVQFPFPDQAQREAIWRGIFPTATPLDGVDCAKLARLNVTGGSIRNIALNAAFLAAEADEQVRMAHLQRAAQLDAAKRERPMTDAETRGWV